MKRCFDFMLACVCLTLLALPMLIVALAVRCTSKGPVLYWSQRVGQHNQLFAMPKFRSMHTHTPALASHLLESPQSWLTPIGGLIRRTSLDELPQLWCIFTGDMSFVGPRPALFNQQDLIDLRTEHGVQILVPGLTGWAQINGRDTLSVAEKVSFDVQYLHNHSMKRDLFILWQTLRQALRAQGVSH